MGLPQSPPVLPDDPTSVSLRELPTLTAPPGSWDEVRRRADSSQRARRRRLPLALAAGAVLVGVAATLFLALPSPAPGFEATPPGETAALLERSQRLEASRSTALSLPPTSTEWLLRARIGGIDASLNDELLHQTTSAPESRERLLRERVELMESLHYLEQYRQRELVRQAVF